MSIKDIYFFGEYNYISIMYNMPNHCDRNRECCRKVKCCERVDDWVAKKELLFKNVVPVVPIDPIDPFPIDPIDPFPIDPFPIDPSPVITLAEYKKNVEVLMGLKSKFTKLIADIEPLQKKLTQTELILLKNKLNVLTYEKLEEYVFKSGDKVDDIIKLIKIYFIESFPPEIILFVKDIPKYLTAEELIALFCIENEDIKKIIRDAFQSSTKQWSSSALVFVFLIITFFMSNLY